MAATSAGVSFAFKDNALSEQPLKRLPHIPKQYDLDVPRFEIADFYKTNSNVTPELTSHLCEFASELPKSIVPQNHITEEEVGGHYLPYKTASSVEFHTKIKLNMFQNNDVLSFPMLTFKGKIKPWDTWSHVADIFNRIYDDHHKTDHHIRQLQEYIGRPDFTRPPENRTHAWPLDECPYIHVGSDGPRQQYTFKNHQVYTCKLKSLVGNSIHDKWSNFFVGTVVPTTLIQSKDEHMDLVFAIVLRTNVENDPNKPENHQNVLEILMAPRGIQCVKFDWGFPYQDTYYNVHSFFGKKTFLKSKYTLNDAARNMFLEKMKESYDMGLNDSRSGYNMDKEQFKVWMQNTVASYMPPRHKRSFLHVDNANYFLDIHQAYFAMAGTFVWESVRLQFMLQLFRKVTYTAICFLIQGGLGDTQIHCHMNWFWGNYVDYVDGPADTRLDAYGTQKVAFAALSHLLHIEYGHFPFGHSLAKYSSYEEEYESLEQLMKLLGYVWKSCHKNNGYTNRITKNSDEGEVHTDADKKKIDEFLVDFPRLLGVLKNAVDNAMGICLSANERKSEGILTLEHFVETLRHKLDADLNLHLQEIRMDEHISPCNITRMRLPIKSETFRCFLDLSDLRLADNAMFEIMHWYHTYEVTSYPRINNKNTHIQVPFLQYEQRVMQRLAMLESLNRNDEAKFLRELWTKHGASHQQFPTPMNKYMLFDMGNVDIDNRLLQWTVMEQHMRPSVELSRMREYLEYRKRKTRGSGPPSSSVTFTSNFSEFVQNTNISRADAALPETYQRSDPAAYPEHRSYKEGTPGPQLRQIDLTSSSLNISKTFSATMPDKSANAKEESMAIEKTEVLSSVVAPILQQVLDKIIAPDKTEIKADSQYVVLLNQRDWTPHIFLLYTEKVLTLDEKLYHQSITLIHHVLFFVHDQLMQFSPLVEPQWSETVLSVGNTALQAIFQSAQQYSGHPMFPQFVHLLDKVKHILTTWMLNREQSAMRATADSAPSTPNMQAGSLDTWLNHFDSEIDLPDISLLNSIKSIPDCLNFDYNSQPPSDVPLHQCWNMLHLLAQSEYKTMYTNYLQYRNAPPDTKPSQQQHMMTALIEGPFILRQCVEQMSLAQPGLDFSALKRRINKSIGTNKSIVFRILNQYVGDIDRLKKSDTMTSGYFDITNPTQNPDRYYIHSYQANRGETKSMLFIEPGCTQPFLTKDSVLRLMHNYTLKRREIALLVYTTLYMGFVQTSALSQQYDHNLNLLKKGNLSVWTSLLGHYHEAFQYLYNCTNEITGTSADIVNKLNNFWTPAVRGLHHNDVGKVMHDLSTMVKMGNIPHFDSVQYNMYNFILWVPLNPGTSSSKGQLQQFFQDVTNEDKTNEWLYLYIATMREMLFSATRIGDQAFHTNVLKAIPNHFFEDAANGTTSVLDTFITFPQLLDTVHHLFATLQTNNNTFAAALYILLTYQHEVLKIIQNLAPNTHFADFKTYITNRILEHEQLMKLLLTNGTVFSLRAYENTKQFNTTDTSQIQLLLPTYNARSKDTERSGSPDPTSPSFAPSSPTYAPSSPSHRPSGSSQRDSSPYRAVSPAPAGGNISPQYSPPPDANDSQSAPLTRAEINHLFQTLKAMIEEIEGLEVTYAANTNTCIVHKALNVDPTDQATLTFHEKDIGQNHLARGLYMEQPFPRLFAISFDIGDKDELEKYCQFVGNELALYLLQSEEEDEEMDEATESSAAAGAVDSPRGKPKSASGFKVKSKDKIVQGKVQSFETYWSNKPADARGPFNSAIYEFLKEYRFTSPDDKQAVYMAGKRTADKRGSTVSQVLESMRKQANSPSLSGKEKQAAVPMVVSSPFDPTEDLRFDLDLSI